MPAQYLRLRFFLTGTGLPIKTERYIRSVLARINQTITFAFCLLYTAHIIVSMNTSSGIGIALIGAGMIAPRHITALSAMQSRATLLAVMSRHPERAATLAQYYDGPPPLFTNNVDAIAQNENVQMVIVATPPSVRVELIETLCNAGKHILLEKPVARNIEEAEKVVHICEQSGSVLGMLFQHQLRDTTLESKRLLASGALGKIGLVEIAVPIWRKQSYYDELDRGTYSRDGGGVLITNAIHTINLALTLAGPVTHVQAMTDTTTLHQMEAEDFAVVGLRFESGAVGSLFASTACFPHRSETITLHGEHGSLTLGAETLDIAWRSGQIDRYPKHSGKADQQKNETPKHVWHQAIIEDFIDALHQGREPVVSGKAALASHRLIDAIESSSRKGVAVEVLR